MVLWCLAANWKAHWALVFIWWSIYWRFFPKREDESNSFGIYNLIYCHFSLGKIHHLRIRRWESCYMPKAISDAIGESREQPSIGPLHSTRTGAISRDESVASCRRKTKAATKRVYDPHFDGDSVQQLVIISIQFRLCHCKWFLYVIEAFLRSASAFQLIVWQLFTSLMCLHCQL